MHQDGITQYWNLGPSWFSTAIKLLVILAEEEELVSSMTLAEKLGVESSFIRKVMAKLMNDNLVEGFGGRYGGYKLVANPAETTIYDVYVALTKDTYIKEQALPANKIDRFISKILAESEGHFSEVLGKYTIADILK